jgi:sulfur dioxygenase
MIFQQTQDPDSKTYTYLLADPVSREAVLIDPVLSRVEHDVALIEELGLKLLYTLDTHVHADHVTGAHALRERLGARTVVGAAAGVACADIMVANGDVLKFGSCGVEARATPGHTAGCTTYVTLDHTRAFTGDALLIGRCGRTDFQEGDAATLYASVHREIFVLPDDCEVFPGHDYSGQTSSTVGRERRENARLGGGRTVEEFVDIMDALDLAYPRHIDAALPANRQCGRAEPIVDEASGWTIQPLPRPSSAGA